MTLDLDARLAANLDAVLAEISAPPRSRFERTLIAVRVPEPTARLVAATPVLRWAWFAAVAVVLLFAASAGENQWSEGDQLAVFLAIAPLVPVASAAAAYGAHTDRAYEVTVAAPLSGLRLLVLRTITVVVAAACLASAMVLAAPSEGMLRIAWLLPSLATTSATLAFGARIGMRRAATVIGIAWLAGVIAVSEISDDATTPFQVPGQITAAAIAAASIVAVALGRQRLERWDGS